MVRLKPKQQEAPPLETDTEVLEPPESELESLLADAQARPSAAGHGAAAQEVADARENLADLTFEEAMTSLKTGNVQGAVLKLQTFAQAYPRHAQSDNALYFSGVGLMALDDFAGAAKAFERVLAEYPAGDARLDAMLKLADCHVKLNQIDDARALYAKLIASYPGTTAATQAKQRLARITQ